MVIKPQLKISPKAVAARVAQQCLKAFHTNHEDVGTKFYYQSKRALDQYRNDVLANQHGEVVECSGTLARRGDGTGNLNLLLAVVIEGKIVDHIKVYDELIDENDVSLGQLFKFKARVYGYNKRGEKKYGLKPTWMPLDKTRGEF